MALYLSFGASWHPERLTNYLWTSIHTLEPDAHGGLDTKVLWTRRRELVAEPGIFMALKKESLGAIRQLEQRIAWSTGPF